MLKKTIVILVTMLLIYFIFGFVIAKYAGVSWFDLNIYFSLGTIIGGIASVCGL